MLPAEPIAFIHFADGTCRPIYDDGRRQYVIDDDGEPVYGVWYVPREYNCDRPIIVRSDPDTL
jgi:hypothetical protein